MSRGRTSWWRERARKILGQAYEEGHLNCPICGREMFYISYETWDEYSLRFMDTYKIEAPKWPQDIAAWQASVDHVIPASKGGSDEDENLIVICKQCNTTKGARLFSEAGMTGSSEALIAEYRALLHYYQKGQTDD